MPKHTRAVLALVGLAIAVSRAAAQGAKAPPLRLRSAEARDRIHAIMTEVDIKQLGVVEGRGFAGLAFQNWRRTDLSLESLLPIARRALQTYAAHSKRTATPDTLFAQFVDYKPQCATLVWVRKPVSSPPDRFIITKAGTVCRPPSS